METKKAVVIEHLNKTYQLDSVQVTGLIDVSIQIAANCFTVLSGPSGSGKSTLLNMIGCIDHGDSGTVLVAGQDVAKLSDNALSDFRAQHIGYIFQSFNLLPVLSAYENIEYPMIMAHMPVGRRHERVMQLLEAVELTEKAHHRPGQLSGGQRQRVAIARALALSPALVLADEPTANLDSRTGNTIIDLMRRMQREYQVSFVFSSHDPKVLAAADEVHQICDGRITGFERIAQGIAT
jgi:putative ABC transport system ATP-binding protein